MKFTFVFITQTASHYVALNPLSFQEGQHPHSCSFCLPGNIKAGIPRTDSPYFPSAPPLLFSSPLFHNFPLFLPIFPFHFFLLLNIYNLFSPLLFYYYYHYTFLSFFLSFFITFIYFIINNLYFSSLLNTFFSSFLSSSLFSFLSFHLLLFFFFFIIYYFLFTFLFLSPPHKNPPLRTLISPFSWPDESLRVRDETSPLSPVLRTGENPPPPGERKEITYFPSPFNCGTSLFLLFHHPPRPLPW